jgi:hypothetical protein
VPREGSVLGFKLPSEKSTGFQKGRESFGSENSDSVTKNLLFAELSSSFGGLSWRTGSLFDGHMTRLKEPLKAIFEVIDPLLTKTNENPLEKFAEGIKAFCTFDQMFPKCLVSMECDHVENSHHF